MAESIKKRYSEVNGHTDKEIMILFKRSCELLLNSGLRIKNSPIVYVDYITTKIILKQRGIQI